MEITTCPSRHFGGVTIAKVNEVHLRQAPLPTDMFQPFDGRGHAVHAQVRFAHRGTNAPVHRVPVWTLLWTAMAFADTQNHFLVVVTRARKQGVRTYGLGIGRRSSAKGALNGIPASRPSPLALVFLPSRFNRGKEVVCPRVVFALLCARGQYTHSVRCYAIRGSDRHPLRHSTGGQHQ